MPLSSLHIWSGGWTLVATVALFCNGCISDEPLENYSEGDTEVLETDGDGQGSSTDGAGAEGSGGETEGGTSAGTGGETAGDTGETPLDAEQRYLSMCAACHGAQAEGTPAGYELRHPSREYATWVVRNGRAGNELAPSVMAAYPPEAISDAELEEIFDWLDAFPQPQTGEGLYLDYCRNCHGVDAAGGESLADIRDKELGDIFEKVREGENEGGDIGARTLYMPPFGPEALTDEEIELIAEYIASL